MPKMNSLKHTKKDSADSGNKAPDRKKPMSKKRGGGAHDDDDSVDSRGNVRGLIAYDDDESEEEFISEEETPSDRSILTPEQRRELRRSARTAAKRGKNRGTPKDAPKKSPKMAMSRRRVVESESEDESAFEEEAPSPTKKKGFMPRKERAEQRVEEEDDEDEDEEEDDDDDEEEDEDDGEDYDEASNSHGGLVISFGGAETADNRMIPKRHNMKKESVSVNKFVELMTKPVEDGGIDDQIDEFKRLSQEKQAELLTTLDRKTTAATNSQSMMFKILGMKLTPETQSMVLAKYNTLQTMDPGAGEYYKLRAWLEKFSSLPIGVYKNIPVKLSDGSESCAGFMERARKCLAEAIYGQEEAKIQILQFIASKIANPDARGLSLMLAGPPGIGKTSLIKNGIAKALEWPFQFISLGGDSDASTYVGHQLVYEGSHCGKIVNSLVSAKSMSMILMFDELDKVSATPKGEEVQHLLVHLTDPVQNGDFEDKYLSGIPLDLSKVLFTFSANDLGKIDRVLMDRMVVIELQGYSAKEKLTIAETFLLPAALKEVNLDEKVSISHDVVEHILKEYAGDEKGVRELKRCVEAVVQKINMLRIFNTKELPFHIPGFQLPFVVKRQHIDLFLKKKNRDDESVRRMYV
jgi:ATP-dependent Clp protease ATP-binding subunit ClpA